jgi:outer membrane immunogenic protein
MNNKIIALAVSGLFLASSSAIAGDKSWEGFKIGIGIGGQTSESKDNTTASHDFNASGSRTSSSDPTSDAVISNTFGTNSKDLDILTNTLLDSGANLTDNGITPTWTGGTAPGGSAPTGFAEGANIYNRNYQAAESFMGSGFSSNDLSKSNAFGTIEAGYDWQVNDKIVVGLNASYNLTSKNRANGTGGGQNSAGWTESYTYNDITNTDNSLGGDGGTGYSSGGNQTIGTPTSAYSNTGDQTSQVGVNSSIQTGNSFDLGGRIGFLANNDTLIFIAGGASAIRAKQNMSYSSYATLDGSSNQGDDISGSNTYYYEASQSNSDSRIGYYLGGGIETRFSDKITAKLEYRYADYGTMTRNSNGTPTLSDDTNGNALEFYNTIVGTNNLSHSSDITAQSIRAVLSYNF